MNLKERGITVGDLLIILIIILTSSVLVKTFNKDKETKLDYMNQQKLLHEKTLLSNIHCDLEASHFKLSFKSLISFDNETKLTI